MFVSQNDFLQFFVGSFFMYISDRIGEWRQGGKIYLPSVLCKWQSVHETGLQGYRSNARETTERTEET